MTVRWAPLALLLGWLAATMFLWWLAFYRAPETTPEWLIRAQSVCFGTNESGIPDTYGWAMLTLGPLSFLGALFAAMGTEIRAAGRHILQSMSGKAAAAVLLMLLAAQGAWAAQRVQEGLAVLRTDYLPEQSGRLPEAYPRGSEPAPWFALQDHRGEYLDLSALQGKTLILTFAFAHCETVCPALVQTARTALAGAKGVDAELLVVTLDPWRDTPRVIGGIAERWKLGQQARLLSGSPDEVMEAVNRYDIPVTRDMKTGDIGHPPLVYVIDPQGRLAYTFSNPPAGWLIDALRLASKS